MAPEEVGEVRGAEGLVTDFTGPGRVWLQTRNSADFVSWIVGKAAVCTELSPRGR